MMLPISLEKKQRWIKTASPSLQYSTILDFVERKFVQLLVVWFAKEASRIYLPKCKHSLVKGKFILCKVRDYKFLHSYHYLDVHLLKFELTFFIKFMNSLSLVLYRVLLALSYANHSSPLNLELPCQSFHHCSSL